MSVERIKPVRPQEVLDLKKQQIPDAVIEAFNELIANDFKSDSSTVMQKDVVKLLKVKGINVNEAFDKGWLDVEGIYIKAGWNVRYDKPAYNESYEPYFVFSRKRKGSGAGFGW